jgi:single-strand DNA-binding protein
MSANITLMGNIGKAPETRVNDNGTLITTFSIASNTVRNTAEGPVKKTDWYRITAFGKQAETLARYVQKGSKLYVQGRLTFNPWMGRNGDPQVSADVVLQEFQFVSDGRRGEAAEAGGEETSGGQVPAMTGPVQETAQVDAF